jgi:hypothetical protein
MSCFICIYVRECACSVCMCVSVTRFLSFFLTRSIKSAQLNEYCSGQSRLFFEELHLFRHCNSDSTLRIIVWRHFSKSGSFQVAPHEISPRDFIVLLRCPARLTTCALYAQSALYWPLIRTIKNWPGPSHIWH